MNNIKESNKPLKVNYVSEEMQDEISKFSDDISKTKSYIKELNKLFKNNNIPVFIATANEKNEIVFEATTPEEVNNDNLELQVCFNRLLKACRSFDI